MSTESKTAHDFDKLPVCFAKQFEEQLTPFLQNKHQDLSMAIALSLFNDAIWKLQPKSWILVQTTHGSYVPKQIHVISIRQNSNGKRMGAFHLIGDPVDEVWNMRDLTEKDLICDDDEDDDDDDAAQQCVPVLESVEKTMELLQILNPNQALLCIPSTESSASISF